jgi:2-keto-4-pentenoate hydratase/2-oxohepta-3-ene-1,7-dioic acid hydratase in catechol pathway
VLTGTPARVGAFRSPPVFLHPGDLVEVGAEGIGLLSNPVGFVSADPSSVQLSSVKEND